MKNTSYDILPFFRKVVIMAFVLFGIVGITYLDATADVSGNKFGETSLTEYSQEAMLFLIIIVAGTAAYKMPRFRPFLISLCYMAAVYLIREFNNYLNDWWKAGIFAVSLVYFPYFYLNAKKIIKQLAGMLQSFGMGVFITGNLILHTYSRIYGQEFIWGNIMEENYHRSVKNASEESLELMAYTIIFSGVLFMIECIYTMNKVQKDKVVDSSEHQLELVDELRG